MRENETSNGWECGALLAVGIVVVAVGTDLVGHLLHFLYGEWFYLCIGLVVVTFAGIAAYIYSRFERLQTLFAKNMETKLAVIEAQITDVRFDRKAIRDEIKTIRRSVDLQWDLCEKTLKEVDKLMAQPLPVPVEVPKQGLTLEPSVQQAIQEVVGGAI